MGFGIIGRFEGIGFVLDEGSGVIGLVPDRHHEVEATRAEIKGRLADLAEIHVFGRGNHLPLDHDALFVLKVEQNPGIARGEIVISPGIMGHHLGGAVNPHAGEEFVDLGALA